MIYMHLKEGMDEGLGFAKIYSLQEYRKTDFQDVAIADIALYGKSLIIDNRIQSSESCYIPYHRTMVPEEMTNGNALVIGAGEGVAMDLLLKQGCRVTAIDIDPELIQMIAEHLSDWNNDIYKNKEVTMIYEDAFATVKAFKDNEFDYIVFDLTEFGASDPCYSEEFISNVHRILAPNGIFAYQDGAISDLSKLEAHVKKVFKKDITTQTAIEWSFSSVEK